MKVRCKVRIHGVERVHEIGEIVEMPDDVAQAHVDRGNAELPGDGEQSTPATRTQPTSLNVEQTRGGKPARKPPADPPATKPADPTPPVDPNKQEPPPAA